MGKSKISINSNPGEYKDTPDGTKVRISLSNGKEFDIYLKETFFQIRETSGETIGINCNASNCIDII